MPKHAQLRAHLLDAIADLEPDTAVPSERELSNRYGVARMTVRQAIDLLVTEGRLYRVPGRGTFVARGKVRLPVRLTSFTSDMAARGMRPGARVLDLHTAPAGRLVSKLLDIPADANVHVIERLRLADDTPMAIERSHVPAALARGLLDHDLENASLYDTLERHFGLTPDAGEESIEAVAASDADAELLRIPAGSPVLLLERIARASGRPIEYVVSRYRGDRYQLRVSLETPAGGPALTLRRVVPATGEGPQRPPTTGGTLVG